MSFVLLVGQDMAFVHRALTTVAHVNCFRFTWQWLCLAFLTVDHFEILQQVMGQEGAATTSYCMRSCRRQAATSTSHPGYPLLSLHSWFEDTLCRITSDRDSSFNYVQWSLIWKGLTMLWDHAEVDTSNQSTLILWQRGFSRLPSDLEFSTPTLGFHIHPRVLESCPPPECIIVFDCHGLHSNGNACFHEQCNWVFKKMSPEDKPSINKTGKPWKMNAECMNAQIRLWKSYK